MILKILTKKLICKLRRFNLFLAVFVFIFIGITIINLAQASAQICTITTTLKQGGRGPEITCLQNHLNLNPDGIFGPKTRASIIAFQQIHNLNPDGIFGPKSRAFLNIPTLPTNGCIGTSLFNTNTGQSCLTQQPTTPVPKPKARSGVINVEKFTLTYIAGSNGSIIGTTSQVVNEGRDGGLVTAIPNAGYVFDTWSDGVLTVSRTDTNVVSDKTVTASFLNSIVLINPYTTEALSLKGQIHVHTTNSDGIDSPVDQVNNYKNAGYDFISITDHNYLTPTPGVSGITYIQGEEVYSGGVKDNSVDVKYHVGAIGISSLINPATTSHTQTVLDLINAQDAFSVLHHPATPGSGWLNTEMQTLHDFTAIEIYNHSWTVGWSQPTGESYWDYLLDRGFKIFGTATDDDHNYATYGNGGWIIVNSETNTEADILKNIKNGNFYASSGATVAISLAGQIITVTTASAGTIEFIGKGGTVLQTNINSTTADYTIIGDEKYVRVRITRDGDNKKAWSNPIFVDLLDN